MKESTKCAIIGGMIGAAGGPIGIGIGIVVGGAFGHTLDPLRDFEKCIKAKARRLADAHDGKLTKKSWDALYEIQRKAHKEEVEKFGKDARGKNAVYTREFVRRLVEEALTTED